MARKSNKTAHVLNLLAGHDAQTPADETPDTKKSAEADAAAGTPASAKPAGADPEPAPAAGTSPVQNISVIDTTGEDPVAELIQQKLSSQFEEAAQDLPADIPAADTDSPADNASGTETDASSDNAYDTDADADADVLADNASGTDADIPADNASGTDADVSEESVSGTGIAVSSESTASSEEALSSGNMPSAPSPTAESDTLGAYSMETASDNVTVPSPDPAPTPEPVSVPAPDPVSPISIPEPESIPGPGPTTVLKKAPEPEPEPKPEPEPDFAYLNVMEAIVKDKIIYFMRQFDVCTCDRCIADTTALTLNGLDPKYVVTTPNAVDPLVSYYTNRLISNITVEATKACMTIKDNPRH